MAIGQQPRLSHFAIQLLDCLRRESSQKFDLQVQARRLADCMINEGFQAHQYRGTPSDDDEDSQWLTQCIVALAKSTLDDVWPCTVPGFDEDFIDHAYRCFRRTLDAYQALWNAYIADSFAQYGL